MYRKFNSTYRPPKEDTTEPGGQFKQRKRLEREMRRERIELSSALPDSTSWLASVIPDDQLPDPMKKSRGR